MHLVTNAGRPVHQERFIRLAEVEYLTGLKKSSLYWMMKQQPPAFPRSVEISPGCVGWSYASVMNWIEERKKAAQDSKAGVA